MEQQKYLKLNQADFFISLVQNEKKGKTRKKEISFYSNSFELNEAIDKV